jgi:hypothetical protein
LKGWVRAAWTSLSGVSACRFETIARLDPNSGLEWNSNARCRLIRTGRSGEFRSMIRKLQSGEYRLYSRKVNPKTGKRRNLGTFKSRTSAEKHERDVQYFKRH